MPAKTTPQHLLSRHVKALNRCSRCPEMIRPVVSGAAVHSKVMLVGQAPGIKEGELGRPFAWTAGKTMFKWFSELGLSETDFRDKIYMAAVCRCFPGKNPKGGDRVPSKEEIAKCSSWLQEELRILKPELVIPVGKLAIAQFMPVDKLSSVVGAKHKLTLPLNTTDCIPLPHPSGASTWHRTEPGKTLLQKALRLIKRQHAFRELMET